MARNYVALPFEYTREMRKLDDADFGRLIRALLLYGETGDTTEPEGFGAFYWERVMLQEDRFQDSYDAVIEARREAARKASAARWGKRKDSDAMPADANACSGNAENAIIETKTKTKTETETETEPLPSIEGEVYAPAARFAPPSGEEVASYCREAGLTAEPEAFVDYYTSKGWKVGAVPMADWRAALRCWARREPAFPGRASPPRGGECRESRPSRNDLQTLAQLDRLTKSMETTKAQNSPGDPGE